MDWQLGGLPLHPMFVHLTAVAVPVAAITAILVAVSARFRRWLGVGSPIVGLVALVSVPLATSSGEWLEARTKETAALELHTRLADGLLPWSIAVFVVMTLWWVWDRRASAMVTNPALRRTVTIVLPVVLVASAIGSGIDVVLIGHAGAASVWSD